MKEIKDKVKPEEVLIKFRKTMPNLTMDSAKFKEELIKRIAAEREKLKTNQGLDPRFMMTHTAKSIRDQLIMEMNIKNPIYEVGKSYKMDRSEAEVYLFKTDYFRDDDNGQVLNPKIYPQGFTYLSKTVKPVAFIVEQ